MQCRALVVHVFESSINNDIVEGDMEYDKWEVIEGVLEKLHIIKTELGILVRWGIVTLYIVLFFSLLPIPCYCLALLPRYHHVY